MKTTMYGAVTVAMALTLAAPVFAQAPAGVRGRTPEEAREAREATQKKLDEVLQTVKKAEEQVREVSKGNAEKVLKEMKAEAEGKREGAKEARDKAVEALRANREVAKDEMKKTREAAKDEIKKAREVAKAKVETNRKELQVKLKTIKDERKRGVVETLSEKFDKLNAGRVEHFGDALDKLGSVLSRISERAAKAKTAGKDVAPVEAAIAVAQKAIDDARAAVTAQAGKVYKVTVTTETKLKDDLGKVRDAYQADVKAAEGKVKDAREAVHAAARTLAGVPGIGELKEALAPATQPATTNP